MSAFNTDYNNNELLDQELTNEVLEAAAGGSYQQRLVQKMRLKKEAAASGSYQQWLMQ